MFVLPSCVHLACISCIHLTRLYLLVPRLRSIRYYVRTGFSRTCICLNRAASIYHNGCFPHPLTEDVQRQESICKSFVLVHTASGVVGPCNRSAHFQAPRMVTIPSGHSLDTFGVRSTSDNNRWFLYTLTLAVDADVDA